MSKINNIVVSLVFAVVLLPLMAQSSLDEAPGTPPAAVKKAPRAQVVRELPQRNTANSRHFLLENGKVEARIGQAPFQYRDRDGNWQPIDTRLISGGGDGFLSNDTNLFSVALPQRADGTLRIGLEQGEVTWIPGRHGFSGQSHPWPSHPGRLAGSAEARFGSDRDFLSERFVIGPGRLKHDMILSRPPAPGQGDYVFWGELRLPEGVSLEQGVVPSEATGPARPLRLVDAAGNTLLVMDPPFAFEEQDTPDPVTGRRASQQSGHWLVEEGAEAGTWRLGVALDGNWLADPARTYPVVVDPTFSTAGGWGGWQNSASGNLEANPTQFAFATTSYLGDQYRAFIQWDTSSITDSVHVEQVEINLYCNLRAGANTAVQVWNVNNMAPFGGYNATYYNDLNGGSLYTSIDVAATGATGYVDLGVRGVSDAQTRLQDGYFSVGLGYTAAVADDFVRFNSADAAGDSLLRVTYDYAPMGGVVITEVNRGSVDAVELYNYGPDITLTGAVLDSFDNALKQYTFPTFTLKKHNFVVIHEGTGTNSATDLYTSGSWVWTTSVGGEVGLTLNGEPLDYVFFGNSASQTTVADGHLWTGGAVPGSSNYVLRQHDGDTHSAYDWTMSTGGTLGSRNPDQVGSRRRSPVVINEAYLGSPDAIELANVSPVDVDVSGWQVKVWTNNSVNGTYTIPDGRVIPAAGYLVIHENNGTDNEDIVFSGFNFGWGSTGEIALYQPDGKGMDYVGFGNGHSTNIPPGVGWTGTVTNASAGSVWRESDLDTDAPADWNSGSATNRTLGWANANQQPRWTTYDEIGSDTQANSTYSGSAVGRGNVYQATEYATVREWRQTLDLPSSQTVNFVIHEEATPGSGTWTVISNVAKTYGPGFDTYSSGSIFEVMVPGRNYAFITYWATGATYLRDSAGGTNHPEYLSFGTYTGWASASFPIDTNVNSNNNSISLHQYIASVEGSNTPLQMLTTNTPDAFNGDSYGLQFRAQGGYVSYTWTVVGGSLPPGLTLSTGGYLSGTAGGAGTYNFTVRVTDAMGQTDQRALSIHVQSSGFVSILTTSLPDGVINAGYPAVQLEAKSVTGSYTWNVSAGSLPPGLTLNSNGTITGTPTALGDYTFTARVVDGNGRVATRSLTITVVRPTSENVWVRRGLFGAELRHVVASPNYATDQTLFTAGEGQNLYKSTDGGATWTAYPVTNQGVIDWWSDLATGPRYNNNGTNGSHKTLVAIIRADGVYKTIRSTNGGTSWSNISVSGNPFVFSIRMSPNYENDGTILLRGIDTLYRQQNFSGWSNITATGVRDVQFSPDFVTDRRIYRIDDDGNFRRSTNWGTWYSLSSSLNLSSANFQISPNFANDSTIYMGGNAFAADQAFRSNDGGYSWEGLLRSEDELYGTLHPLPMHETFDFTDSNSDTVFFQDWTSSGFEARIYRSDDGGDTFQPFSSMPPVEHDDDPDTVNMRGEYILSPDWENDNTMFHARTGFWLSRDDGLTWELRTRGINGLRVREVHVSPNYATDGTIFIVAKAGGLFKSTNFGDTFTLINIPMDGDPSRNDPGVYSAGISPTYNDLGSNGTGRTIYAGSNYGFYRSTNGGTSWTAITSNPMNPGEFGDPIEIIKLPPNYASSQYVLVGSVATGQGFYRYYNPTESWTLVRSVYAQPDTLYAAFSPYYNLDGFVIVSYEDPSTFDPVTYKTTSFTVTTPSWTQVTDAGAPIGGPIHLSNIYYNLTNSPGTAWNTFWVGNEKTTDRGSAFSAQAVAPLALSTNFNNDNIVFAAGNGTVSDGLYRSANGGSSYSEIGGSAFNQVVIDSLGVFPGYDTSNGRLMAGTVGSGVSLSSDGGTTFTPTEGTASISEDVRGVDTDPVDPGIVYAATGDGGLFKSTDQGLTFHHLTDGLPTVNQEFNSIRALTSSTIIAGHAVDGVYRSTDGGASWANVASTTGSVVTFSEGGGAVWGAREDGRSIKSTNSGSSWVELDPVITDMADFSYAGDVPSTNSFQDGSSITNQSFKPGQPGLVAEGSGDGGSPLGLTSPTWGVSKTSGPAGSEDGGVTFTSSTGAGGPFPLPSGVDYLSVQVNSADNLQVLTGTNGMGVWKTWDGGDTWHRMTRGLESSSQVVAELYETSNGDILAGITGTTDGGVYLSADGGVHWVVINEGFDPDELSVQDLVNDPGDGTEISYWAGKDADGIWTRTIEVLPNPTVSSVSVTTGTALGGTATTITGTNFQDGAVVEFNGVPGVTTWVSDTTLTVITPAHYVGTAQITVVNPDTRSGLAGQSFTFTTPGTLVDLTVTTDGTDVTLSWTDGNGKSAYNVFWSNDPTFSNEWVELASENDPGPSWVHQDAATTSFVYFYKVE